MLFSPVTQQMLDRAKQTRVRTTSSSSSKLSGHQRSPSAEPSSKMQEPSACGSLSQAPKSDALSITSRPKSAASLQRAYNSYISQQNEPSYSKKGNAGNAMRGGLSSAALAFSVLSPASITDISQVSLSPQRSRNESVGERFSKPRGKSGPLTPSETAALAVAKQRQRLSTELIKMSERLAPPGVGKGGVGPHGGKSRMDDYTFASMSSPERFRISAEDEGDERNESYNGRQEQSKEIITERRLRRLSAAAMELDSALAAASVSAEGMVRLGLSPIAPQKRTVVVATAGGEALQDVGDEESTPNPACSSVNETGRENGCGSLVADALPNSRTYPRNTHPIRHVRAHKGNGNSTKVSRLRKLASDSPILSSREKSSLSGTVNASVATEEGATASPDIHFERSNPVSDRRQAEDVPSAPYYAASTAPSARADRGLAPLGLLRGAAGGDAAPSLEANMETLYRQVEDAWWGGISGANSAQDRRAARRLIEDRGAQAAGVTGVAILPRNAVAHSVADRAAGVIVEPSERCSNFFFRTKRLFDALSLCIPRLGPLLEEASAELNVSQRYTYELGVRNRDIAREHASLERSMEERIQSVRYECTRDVQQLSDDLAQKSEELSVALKTCESLRERLDSVSAEKKKATEQVRTYQGLLDQGRIEAVSLSSQIQQMLDKSNELLAENKFLRGMADHNLQLLQDVQIFEERIKELKKDNSLLLQQQVDAVKERDKLEEKLRRSMALLRLNNASADS